VTFINTSALSSNDQCTTMTFTKKGLVKTIVAQKMQSVAETCKENYAKTLNDLYKHWEQKELDDILLYYNTINTDKPTVTVDQVSDLL